MRPFGCGTKRRKVGKHIYVIFWRHRDGRRIEESLGREDEGGLEKGKRRLLHEMHRYDLVLHKEMLKIERSLTT